MKFNEFDENVQNSRKRIPEAYDHSDLNKGGVLPRLLKVTLEPQWVLQVIPRPPEIFDPNILLLTFSQ